MTEDVLFEPRMTSYGLVEVFLRRIGAWSMRLTAWAHSPRCVVNTTKAMATRPNIANRPRITSKSARAGHRISDFHR